MAGGISRTAFTLWFFFGGKSEKTPARVNGAVIYACPMHAWITSTDPAATCSICAMKLVRRD
jgi:hypothetical protein